MKKVLIALLAVSMLFAFTACDDDPNDKNVVKPVFTNDFSGTADELKEVFGEKANMVDGGKTTNGGAYLKLTENIDLTKGYNISFTFDLEDTISNTVGFNTSAHYDGTYINAFVEFENGSDGAIKASLRENTEGNLTQTPSASDISIDASKDITVSVNVKETEAGTVEMTGAITNGGEPQSIGTITCSTELTTSNDLVWTIYYGTGTDGDGSATILTMKNLTITPLA